MRERELKRECELGYALLTCDFLQNYTLYELYIIHFSEDTLIAAELINATQVSQAERGNWETEAKMISNNSEHSQRLRSWYLTR